MNRFVRLTVGALVLLGSCDVVFATTADLGLSLGGGFTELKDSASLGHSIGKGAGAFDFRGETLFNHRLHAAAGGLLTFYNDRNDFSEMTRDLNGNTEYSKSSLVGISGFVEVGFHQPISSHFYAGVDGGVMFTPNPKRSILNCTNCGIETVNIGGTETFLAPVVGYSCNPGLKIELEYRKFIGNRPLDQMALLSVGYWWRIKNDPANGHP